jgi:hypothetical protein
MVEACLLADSRQLKQLTVAWRMITALKSEGGHHCTVISGIMITNIKLFAEDHIKVRFH